MDDNDAPSTQQDVLMLEQLQRVEQALLQLAQISADAADCLAQRIESSLEKGDASPPEDNFKQITEAFFSLTNKVQYGLKTSVRTMVQFGWLRHLSTAQAYCQYDYYASLLEQETVLLPIAERVLKDPL